MKTSLHIKMPRECFRENSPVAYFQYALAYRWQFIFLIYVGFEAELKKTLSIWKVPERILHWVEHAMLVYKVCFNLEILLFPV